MSDGETQQEAIANVQDAVRAWIEAAEEMGRAVPRPHPTSFESIVSRGAPGPRGAAERILAYMPPEKAIRLPSGSATMKLRAPEASDLKSR